MKIFFFFGFLDTTIGIWTTTTTKKKFQAPQNKNNCESDEREKKKECILNLGFSRRFGLLFFLSFASIFQTKKFFFTLLINNKAELFSFYIFEEIKTNSVEKRSRKQKQIEKRGETSESKNHNEIS